MVGRWIAAFILWSASLTFAQVHFPDGSVTGQRFDVAPWPVQIPPPEPRYPEQAVFEGISANVDATVELSETGDVTYLSVYTRSEGYGFEDSVETALKQWKFIPAKMTSAGTERDVPSRFIIQFRFVCNDAELQDLLDDDVYIKVQERNRLGHQNNPLYFYQPAPIPCRVRVRH